MEITFCSFQERVQSLCVVVSLRCGQSLVLVTVTVQLQNFARAVISPCNEFFNKHRTSFGTKGFRLVRTTSHIWIRICITVSSLSVCGLSTAKQTNLLCCNFTQSVGKFLCPHTQTIKILYAVVCIPAWLYCQACMNASR